MATIQLSQIGQIAVVVQDVQRAAAFYRDVLGMKLLFEVSNMAFFDCAGIRLMLSAPENPEFTPCSSIIYYRVPDLHASAQALESQGVKFEAKPHRVARMKDHDLWMAFLRDSESNLLALMSELPPAKEG
jgi:methylmalonyl-CoA/ethylmalonyl-CoA epimerase